MAWIPEAITPGEIDALREAAYRACAEDTRYPLWRSSSSVDGGQCAVIASWLVSRLGGYVGTREGHYAWLSPDRSYVLDLTGGHSGTPYYGPNEGYRRIVDAENSRSRKFARRADRIFERLADLVGADPYPAEEPQRADDLAQQNAVEQYWHDEPNLKTPEGEYLFVYANGQLEVTPSDQYSHSELLDHLGLNLSHKGPMAFGFGLVTDNQATWQVHSNVNLHTIARILKDYTKHVGWKWGGVANIDGEPVSDEFAPKKSYSLQWLYANDHLYLGHGPHAELSLQAPDSARRSSDSVAGTVRVQGDRAYVSPIRPVVIASLQEWAEDAGLTLYALNTGLKNREDIQDENLGSPNAVGTDNPVEPNAPTDDRGPSGLYTCPACNRLFPSWHLYQRHRKDHDWSGGDSELGEENFPELDMDATFPPHFTEQQPMVSPTSSVDAQRVDGYWRYAKTFALNTEDAHHYTAFLNGSPVGYGVVKDDKVLMIQAAIRGKGIGSAIMRKIMQYHPHLESHAFTPEGEKLMQSHGWVKADGELWKWAAGTRPSQMLNAPVPFIYDVKNDQIHVGNPGQRTSDIPGRFTPGGIVEGVYEPGGKVLLTTMTNMPYTVRHMIELWYYSHPELEVKSVSLQDDAGRKTKLAAEEGVADALQALVHADPAVERAVQALQAEGGHVYAVGGCVRDAVMGNEPKDIDLMVRGLPAHQVQGILHQLPGRVDYTGQDFGVFRYKHLGHEVEIALPRRERSTGDDHKDFDVQADHTMTAEDDLGRRDFTANAMGLDLQTGQIIDPYNGQDDINNGVLRTVFPNALKEDPLRTVRALVAHGRHNLMPDERTRAQMAENASKLVNLPGERIQAELDKLFASKNPAAAIRLAHETGVLKYLIPDVDAAFGYDQNNPHHELELGQHLLSVLERVSHRSSDKDLRLAALLHDIGKPASAWVDPDTGKNHYYYDNATGQGQDHEVVGAKMARDWMEGLGNYKKDRIDRVHDLILHHMFPAFTGAKGARRFLNRVGDHANDLLTLRWGDQGGKSVYPTDPSLSLDTQAQLIDQVRNEGQATSQRDLAINGNDLIAEGVPQGPQIGQILNLLTEAVLENPALNTRDELLQLARNYVTI